LGKLIQDLENQHTKGKKSFPQKLPDAFIYLNNWKSNPRNLQRHNMNKGVAFATKVGNASKGNKKKQGPYPMLQL